MKCALVTKKRTAQLWQLKYGIDRRGGELKKKQLSLTISKPAVTLQNYILKK